MVESVAPQRRSSDQIIDSAYDDHLKEMEVNNPQALSLVRRLLQDSAVTFPMTVPARHSEPIRLS
jgi:hypothetical protein